MVLLFDPPPFCRATTRAVCLCLAKMKTYTSSPQFLKHSGGRWTNGRGDTFFIPRDESLIDLYLQNHFTVESSTRPGGARLSHGFFARFVSGFAVRRLLLLSITGTVWNPRFFLLQRLHETIGKREHLLTAACCLPCANKPCVVGRGRHIIFIALDCCMPNLLASLRWARRGALLRAHFTGSRLGSGGEQKKNYGKVLKHVK